jgi:signal transduction histidine kinase
MEDHGGTISIESQPGEGTTVSLDFPIEPGQTDRRSETTA